MTFRTKLLVVSSLTVAGAVALVTGAVSIIARRSFERIAQDQRKGILNQFQREVQSQSHAVEDKVSRVAASDAVLQIAVEANRPQPDFSEFVDEARQQALAQALDYVDILQQDETIISSANAPARFGYRNNWLISSEDRTSGHAFLTRVPLDDGSAVAIAAIRPVNAGERSIFIIGARRLDPSFLASLEVLPGMRPLLWLASGEFIGASGAVSGAERLAPLFDRVRRTRQDVFQTVQWTPDRYSTESIVALPLVHGDTLLGAFLVGTSLSEQIWLERSILWTGLLVGGAGILLGILMGFWTTARVTRPVASLVSGANAVAAGDWTARVSVSSSDEIGQLAAAFNKMTEQLIEHRDRAIQAERVAAWRELARRLAHELKNPLFPLQITIENLQRAREQHPDQFDEVFRESTTTLLAELQNLKAIIGQFSDFAKMPKPEIEMVDANNLARDVVRLFDAQFHAEGRPAIEPCLELTSADVRIQADPLQVARALRNLVLNAMDAMPEGGMLRIRTQRLGDFVRIEISDTGTGLSEEEAARLFTPYYTTRRHGTGLGLAIVQSVVSDHEGRISVASQPGQGATFTIDLPARRNA